ncbi:MAG: hypothetical protein QOK37_3570 [Thermoanaerobaculia bacterium]|jgi:hypothetical protein|nr:hypothetical protein [Thermoanaerobaculia bacterium]
MQSKAATVSEYLASLPADRRAAIERVRRVIIENLDKDYEEGMSYGMIGYYVPHRVFPAGYHCDPKQGLPFAALASQKNFMSVYLMGLYCGCVDGVSDTALVRWFRDAWAKTGKKLDMGTSCIRFKKIDDLALDILGEAIRRMPAKVYIEHYLKARADYASAKGTGKTATKRRQSV